MKKAVVIAVVALAFTAADRADGRSCTEGDPCWNWATMGNHRRGVETTGQRLLVVGPCRYAHLARSGHLAPWNPDLRGDAWALRHCR